MLELTALNDLEKQEDKTETERNREDANS
jgi:hypothetical protein